MIFLDFVEAIKRDVEKKVNANVIIKEVNKNNGVTFIGITIENDEKLNPVLYLEDYYEHYIDGVDIGTIGDGIIKTFDNYYKKSSLGIDTDKLADKEFWLNNLCKVVVNKEMNKNTDIYLEDYLDIAIEYKVMVGENMTLTITNQHMAKLGITPEELHNNAHNLEYKAKDINQILFGMSASEMGIESVPMMVVTTENMMFGASVITDIEYLDELSKSIGDFLIIPSSIHEIIVIPKEFWNDEIKNLISTINATELDDEDILSNSAYFYDSTLKKVFIA